MADRVYVLDDATGKFKRGPSLASLGGLDYIDTQTVNLILDEINGELSAEVVISGIIEDQITDGETQKAPTSNAVFDALETKRDKATPSFTDEDFDIASPASFVQLAANIEATTLIDVYINGVLTREGLSQAWTRDTTLDRILFNNAVQENAWVRVRMFT